MVLAASGAAGKKKQVFIYRPRASGAGEEKVVVIGPRQSGKTCFAIGLYSFMRQYTDAKGDLIGPCMEGGEYLKRVCSLFEEGKSHLIPTIPKREMLFKFTWPVQVLGMDVTWFKSLVLGIGEASGEDYTNHTENLGRVLRSARGIIILVSTENLLDTLLRDALGQEIETTLDFVIERVEDLKFITFVITKTGLAAVHGQDLTGALESALASQLWDLPAGVDHAIFPCTTLGTWTPKKLALPQPAGYEELLRYLQKEFPYPGHGDFAGIVQALMQDALRKKSKEECVEKKQRET